MPVYQLSPAFLTRLRRRFLWTGLPMVLLSVAVGLWMGGIDRGSTPIILITLPIVAGAVGFGLYRGFKLQKRAWSSYRLYLEEGRVRREQDGLPAITIARKDMSKISESPRNGMTVHSAASLVKIHIPATLDGYDGARMTLAGWCPIDEVPGIIAGWNTALSSLAGLATLGAFVVIHTASNPIVVMAVGVALAVALLACFVSIRRSGQVPAQTKRGMWFLLLVVAEIAAKVWLALKGR